MVRDRHHLCPMGDEVLYLGKLRSLRELRSQQKLLSRSQWRLEQLYSEHSQCCEVAERCAAEVARLREERGALVKRLQELDSDIQRLSELSDQLSGGESLRSLSVPLDDYSSMLEQVNTTRRTLGMSPLDVCDAYTRLAQVHVRQSEVQRSDSLLPQPGKAGKSHKSCPHCYKFVSRNAIMCPGCSAPCSKRRSLMKLVIGLTTEIDTPLLPVQNSNRGRSCSID